jgi:phenylalanyl-tRNA synthetase beta chain
LKVSLNWLKDYINLDDVSVEEITDKLTIAGLEVDDVVDGSKIYENFVIGYVKEKDTHPNADKLSLCLVTDGKDDYKVVCGAPNVEAGQKIVFAKVGAVIPKGEFKITKAKIRGEESVGMICAEDELGLSDDHSGIMVLDDSYNVGDNFADAMKLNDVIIDVDLTPNRADAMSHIGVARDLAAIMNKQFKYPEIKLKEFGTSSEKLASVEIENSVNCPRYVGKVVSGITIKESPEWLKNKLIAIGLRPINNVVDVTNFVMHEIGQPLHAFDLDKLADKKIIVKDAGSDTKFITLDSKERKLNPDDLMICDGKKQVAIAGVMGGENSEVTNETKNILIESAYFNPSAVRKTSKTLGLSTDASYRFERGVDYSKTKWAAQRAAQLIAELAEGTAAKGEIDAYPNPIEKNKVMLRFLRVDKVLGYKIEKPLILDILKRLEFEVVNETESDLELLVPSTRPDVLREVDVIEEIARIHGYDNIPVVGKNNCFTR